MHGPGRPARRGTGGSGSALATKLRFEDERTFICVDPSEVAPGVVVSELEYETLDPPKGGPTVEPESLRNRPHRLVGFRIELRWSSLRRGLASLGSVRLTPREDVVDLELTDGTGPGVWTSIVAVTAGPAPGNGPEVQVVFDPAWVFGQPDGPTVRTAERVRQACVRQAARVAPQLVPGIRAVGTSSFVIDVAHWALTPMLASVPVDELRNDGTYGVRVHFDEVGVTITVRADAPRESSPAFAEALARQVDLNRGAGVDGLLSRGRWTEAFDGWIGALDEDGGPAALLHRILELGMGVPELRSRVVNMATQRLRSNPDWIPGLLVRGAQHRHGGDLDASRRDYERAAHLLKPVSRSAAGLALMHAAHGLESRPRSVLLEECLALRPNDTLVLDELAALLPRVDRVPAAVRVALRLAQVAEDVETRVHASLHAGRLLRDRMNEPTRAAEAFLHGLAQAPDDPTLEGELALAEAAAGRTGGAIRRLQRVVGQLAEARSKRLGPWSVALSDLLLEAGRDEEAKEALDVALTLDPSDGDVLARAIDRALASEDAEQARELWRRSSTHLPARGGGVAAALVAAARAFTLHDPRQAEQLLLRAQEADPRDPGVLEWLAGAADAATRVEAALDLAALRFGEERWSEGAEALRPIVEVDRARDRIGALLDEALTRAPDEPALWWRRSEWARGRGDVDEVERAARELLRLEPDRAGPIQLERARALEAVGDVQEALRALEQARRHEAVRHEAAAMMARILLDRRDFDRARAIVDRALDGSASEESRRLLLLRRAQSWLGLGRPRAALADAEASVDDSEHPSPAWLVAARVALAAGYPETAMRWSQAVMDHAGLAKEARLQAGLLILKAGDEGTSGPQPVELLTRLLDLVDPGSTTARQVRDRLRQALHELERYDALVRLDRASARAPGMSPVDRAVHFLSAARIAHEKLEEHEEAALDAAQAVQTLRPTTEVAFLRQALRLALDIAESRSAHEEADELRAQLADLVGPEARDDLLLEQVDDWIESGQVERARIALAEASGRASASSRVTRRFAEILERLGDHAGAGRWLGEAARRAETEGEAALAAVLHERAAVTLVRIGMISSAEHHDQAVLSLVRHDRNRAVAAADRMLERARDVDDDSAVADLLARRAVITGGVDEGLELGLVLAFGLDRPEEAVGVWGQSAARATGVRRAVLLDELGGMLSRLGRHRERVELHVDRAEQADEPGVASRQWYEAGRVAHGLGATDEAVAYLDRAVQADPEHRAAHQLRSSLGKNDDPSGWEGAVEAVRERVGLGESLEDGLVVAATAAREELQRAAVRLMRVWALAEGRAESADRDRMEHDAELLDGEEASHLAAYLDALGLPDEARRPARQVWASIGRLRSEAEEFDRALFAFDRCAQLATDDGDRARWLTEIAGVYEWGEGDGEQAEREYRAALALDPARVDAREGLSRLLASQDRYQELAADCGLEALRRERDAALEQDSDGRRALTATEVLVERWPEEAADEWMGLAQRLDPDSDLRPALWARAARAGSTEAIDRLRRAYEAVGDAHVERGRLAGLLVGLVPPDERPALLLAQVHGETPPHEAVRLCEQVLDLQPDHPEALARLREALASAGEWALLSSRFGTGALDDWWAELAEHDPRREGLLVVRARAGHDEDWVEAAWSAWLADAPERAWTWLVAAGPAGAVTERGRLLYGTLLREGPAPETVHVSPELGAVLLTGPTGDVDNLVPWVVSSVLRYHSRSGIDRLIQTVGSTAIDWDAALRDDAMLEPSARLDARLARSDLHSDPDVRARLLEEALVWALDHSVGGALEVVHLWASAVLDADAFDAPRILHVFSMLEAKQVDADRPQLLYVRLRALAELSRWEEAETSADRLLDFDAPDADLRRSAARFVIGAAGLSDRLRERAWVELARPETARSEQEQKAALLELSRVREAGSEPPAEVARPLELVLGLSLEPDEELAIRRRLIRLFEGCGDWAAAERHQTAVAEATDQPDAWLSAADLRAWLDDATGADEAIRRALLADPGHAEAHEARVRRAAQRATDEDLVDALLQQAEDSRDLSEEARAAALAQAVDVAVASAPGRLDATLAALGALLPHAGSDDRLANAFLRGSGALGPEAEEARLASVLDDLPRGAPRDRLLSRRVALARARGVSEESLSALDREPAAPFTEESDLFAARSDERLAAARKAARRGDLEQALRLWPGVNDGEPALQRRRIEWLSRLGRDDEIDELLAREPPERAAGLQLFVTRVRWLRGQAVRLKEDISRLGPELDADGKLEAVDLLSGAGESAAAIELIDGVLAGDPADLRWVWSRALIDERRGDWDGASERLRPHMARSRAVAQELARIRAANDDWPGVLACVEGGSTSTALDEELDRCWAALRLRKDFLGESCADPLDGLRRRLGQSSAEDLAACARRLRVFAEFAERSGRPVDARDIRERLAAVDPVSRRDLLEDWRQAGRHDAVVSAFEVESADTAEDHFALVHALSSLGRQDEAVSLVGELVNAEPARVESLEGRARRLILAARVALQSGDVVRALDWGRLANWLVPGSFEVTSYVHAIEAGPPTPEKISLLWERLLRSEDTRERRNITAELDRCLEALPDPTLRARLVVERSLDGPGLDFDALERELQEHRTVDHGVDVLERAVMDEARSSTERKRAALMLLVHHEDVGDFPSALTLAGRAFSLGLDDDDLAFRALQVARRAGMDEAELGLLETHSSLKRTSLATRQFTLWVERDPARAVRILRQAVPTTAAPHLRTVVDHCVRVLRRLHRYDAEVELWARVAGGSQGQTRAAAFSRVAVIRSVELDDRRGARAAWRAAVEASPADLNSRRGLIEACLALGDRGEAGRQAREAMRQARELANPAAVVAFGLDAAHLAAENSDAAEELELWRELLIERPESALILDSLVARARSHPQPEALLDVLESSAASRGAGFSRGRIRVAAARILERPLGRSDAATRLREAARREDLQDNAAEAGTVESELPEMSTSDLGVSRAALRLSGRYDDWAALETARARGSIEPAEQARIWLEVARIHASRRDADPDRVREALHRSIGHHPAFAPALAELVRFEFRQENWTAARRAVERLHRVGGPGWAAGELELLGARIAMALGEPSEARRWLALAAERDPESLAPWRRLVDVGGDDDLARALPVLQRRLDPELDRRELARTELELTRILLSRGAIAEAASNVARALELAPEIEGAWSLRRSIAEVENEPQGVQQAVMLAAVLGDRPEAWVEAVELLDAANDAARVDRVLARVARSSECPPSLRPRLIGYLRFRGDHEAVVDLLELEGGLSAASDPTPEELSTWARVFDQRDRPADVLRVLAHARGLGLLEPVLAGLAPYAEEADNRVDVDLWVTSRAADLDARVTSDPKVRAMLEEMAERRPDPRLHAALVDAYRDRPAEAVRWIRELIEQDPFDLGRLETHGSLGVHGPLALRSFIASGRGRLAARPGDWDGRRLARLCGSDAESARDRFEDLGIDSLEEIQEGVPPATAAVVVRRGRALGYPVVFDPEYAEVRLGRAWFDHATETERRFVATQCVVEHVLGTDRRDLADQVALVVVRDLAAAFAALRRGSWTSLVDEAEDPRSRTRAIECDPRLRRLFVACARGTLP